MVRITMEHQMSHSVPKISADAKSVIDAGLYGYEVSGTDMPISDDQAVNYAIGDLFLTYAGGDENRAVDALREIALLYIHEKKQSV